MAEEMAAAARQKEEDPENNPPPEMMERMQPRVRDPGRATKAEMSAAEEPRNKPATLKEALNELTLSILLYDENKAGRMVFINGRKYVEGDYVENTYLLENIDIGGRLPELSGRACTAAAESEIIILCQFFLRRCRKPAILTYLLFLAPSKAMPYI